MEFRELKSQKNIDSCGFRKHNTRLTLTHICFKVSAFAASTARKLVAGILKTK